MPVSEPKAVTQASPGAAAQAETPPPWFVAGLDVAVEAGSVVVDDATIRYLARGERGAPTLVLVHGGAAHARWWDAHAPLLAQHHRVVALDLSGHGDSDHREVYSPVVWAREVMAVADDAGGGAPVVVVGHSMGGFVTIVAAARLGERLEGAIVLDTPLRREDPESDEARGGRMFRAPKTYPDLATAAAHFHLVPPQPCDNGWLLEHTARHSLRQVDDGWTWKFDPRLFVSREGPNTADAYANELAHASCRFAVVNGARSRIVDTEVRAYMAELVEGSPAGRAGVPFVEIPEAHHHLQFDQPLAVVTAIRAVLATWHPVGAAPPPVMR